MKPKFKDKIRYKFENFMAKGGVSIFIALLILFFGAMILCTIIRSVILIIDPNYDIFKVFFEHFWLVFLEITDPGNVGNEGDFSIAYKVIGIITIMLGLIIFSMLIAFITTQVEQMVYNFRRGKSKVLENKHTLIIGWNERLFDIIREIIIANESEKNASIVILADEDKEMMDDMVAREIPKTKTTRIVTRSGDTSSLNNLDRVSAKQAKSVVILSSCVESASPEEKALSDIKVMKTILAITEGDLENAKCPIVAEIYTDEKRKIIDSFNSSMIIAVNTYDILGKLLVQTSLTSGLAIVYSEILSFDGCEIYFAHENWGNIPFGELAYHLTDGIPLGIHKKDGTVNLRPDPKTILESTDEILVVADDDSTINLKKQELVIPKDHKYSKKKIKRIPQRNLILGWHSIGNIIVREYADYLLDGSVIDIMIEHPSERVKNKINEMNNKYSNLKMSLVESNPMSVENLKKMNPLTYNNVIILSQSEEDYNPERVDSDTLVILLIIRKIIKDLNLQGKKLKTQIITQVLNSENQELIQQSNADDFIISNKLISMVMAQLSEQPKIFKFYDDIFKEEGSEIYLKPAILYFDEFPVKVSFADIIFAVQKRNEICLGYRIKKHSNNPDKNFGVKMNPDKKEILEIQKNDLFVVLAEDEL